MSTDKLPLTDVGPATPTPRWCLPDALPDWSELTERAGGGTVCTWCRDVSSDVWIQSEDRVVGGRVMRSEPRIVYGEPPAAGVTCEQALELARGLTAAADIIACAALDETSR